MQQHRTDLGLLVLRVALGVVFVAHGWQKLTVFGHGGLAGFFASVGLPFADMNAVIVTAVELLGGLALLAGAGTRVAGTLLATTMVVATATVHLANGFFMANNGYEFTLTLLLANLALVLTGAGRFSVDRVLFGPSAVERPTVERPFQRAA